MKGKDRKGTNKYYAYVSFVNYQKYNTIVTNEILQVKHICEYNEFNNDFYVIKIEGLMNVACTSQSYLNVDNKNTY